MLGTCNECGSGNGSGSGCGRTRTCMNFTGRQEGDVCCAGKDERRRVRAIVLGNTVRYHRHINNSWLGQRGLLVVVKVLIGSSKKLSTLYGVCTISVSVFIFRSLKTFKALHLIIFLLGKSFVFCLL